MKLTTKESLFLIAIGIAFHTILILASAGLFYWDWNITMTRVFGVGAITYRESLGLMLICWLLYSKLSRNSGRKNA